MLEKLKKVSASFLLVAALPLSGCRQDASNAQPSTPSNRAAAELEVLQRFSENASKAEHQTLKTSKTAPQLISSQDECGVQDKQKPPSIMVDIDRIRYLMFGP